MSKRRSSRSRNKRSHSIRSPSSRSDDALATMALLMVARALYPSACQLVRYVVQTDNHTLRADMRATAESMARTFTTAAERLIALVEDSSLSGEAERVAELERELQIAQEELRADHQTVARLQSERTQQDIDIRQQAQDAETARAGLQAEIDELRRELEEVKESNRKLQAKSDSYLSTLRERAQSSAPPLEIDQSEESGEPVQLTISGAIEMAREQYESVVVPDAALKEIDALEADEKSSDWAREILRGIEALHAYTEDAEHFTGGFWEWCEHSNNPKTWNASAAKLAMSESDTVRNDSRLWKQRRFVVSNKVDPSGYKHMEAHLKISEGGGQHIPRLYFYDDTKGRTRHVHIGFIGPHRLVQTGQS